MGCGVAEATGLGFVCFVASCVVSQQSWFGFFCNINFSFYAPPPQRWRHLPRLLSYSIFLPRCPGWSFCNFYVFFSHPLPPFHPSCVISQQGWFWAFFCFNNFLRFTPPPLFHKFPILLPRVSVNTTWRWTRKLGRWYRSPIFSCSTTHRSRVGGGGIESIVLWNKTKYDDDDDDDNDDDDDPPPPFPSDPVVCYVNPETVGYYTPCAW